MSDVPRARGPQIGYLLPTRENVMRGDHSVSSLVEAARAARDMGFDSVWAGDSLFARPRHDPLTLLAAVATALPEILVGTAVLLPALRNPVLLAQQLATLDQVSEGRFIAGIGIAADNPSVRAEFTAASVPFEKRVGRLVEGMDLCRALWSGRPVDWTGRWSLDNVTLAPEPYRKGGPPIWMAANVEPGVRRAARRFDGWFPIGPTADAVGANRRILAQAAADAGRDTPTTAVYLTICIDRTPERAEAQIDQYLEAYYGVPSRHLRAVQACCGGTIDAVMAFLERFAAVGAEHLVLRIVGDHPATLSRIAENRAMLA
jgi:alkanesulfonate monooxygenase SsuD/methylene tetrahydromethanopterin reductase-like flavin-dependent oxidoreductase (luciferase family)